MVAVPFLALLAAHQQSQPPLLLTAALTTLPGVRLLDSDRAWIVEDLDADKRPDVAAVVVKSTPGGTEHGVIAVHAGAPQEIQWIIDFDKDSISGVAIGKARDTVVPLFCADSDTNVWFRWSGEEYEAELHKVGENIDIG